MMGERQVDQVALFYEFSLERHVPSDHMLRSIDRFVDLADLRAGLAPFYSPIGRPSIDPELLIRMLLVGYCFGIRPERRLCEEVRLNLAYRWCAVPDSDGALSILSRQEEDALWEAFFTAAPARRRVFEPSSKRRKRAAGPLPPATA